MIDITEKERLKLIAVLSARARHQTKKLMNAHGKTLHPTLVSEMNTDLNDCMALALKLTRQSPCTASETSATKGDVRP